ncbi:MAG: hemolysin III family protein [Gammaproteobacteria bacterium]|nr:hemolysin III family protein [Gammaproteobacteria bacterium]
MYQGEWFNSITHLLGAVAALAGCAVLVVFASLQGDPWKIVSFSVYGSTLFLLYLFSVLYHSLRGDVKNIFRRLDHLAIYLLIAGTYTPFTLVTLNGSWGWSIFAAVWGLALVGMVIEFIPQKKRIIPVIIYLVMGWICLVALKPLLAALPMAGFWWLLAGGLFYTFGVIFYVFDKKVVHFHGIWHLFVLAGSACHYFSVLWYVL